MPAVSVYSTVIVLALGFEMLIVKSPLSHSVMVMSSTLMVGVASSSVIVAVHALSAIVALVGLVRSIVKVSLLSSIVSSMVLTVTVVCVAPGLMLAVPPV